MKLIKQETFHFPDRGSSDEGIKTLDSTSRLCVLRNAHTKAASHSDRPAAREPINLACSRYFSPVADVAA